MAKRRAPVAGGLQRERPPDGVNANVPVNAPVVTSTGDNSANPNDSNDATSTASNDAKHYPNSDQSQSASSPGPWVGSGGSGQAQFNAQEATTGQAAFSTPTRTRTG